jgi:hypothetical protein
MTDPSTIVALAPIVNPLADYINTAVGSIAGLAVTTVCAYAVKYLHVTISQSFVDAATAEAKKQAGILISKATTSLATQSIDTHSSEVAVAANWAATQIPDVLKKAGMTPDDFAHTIVGELGKMTAATAAPALEPAQIPAPAKP